MSSRIIRPEELEAGMELQDDHGNIVVVDEVREKYNGDSYDVTLTDGRSFNVHYTLRLMLAEED